MSNCKCTMRADLVAKFPEGFISGDCFILPNELYEYQWTGEKEETFQVLARNEEAQCTEYQNANSVDFDF